MKKICVTILLSMNLINGAELNLRSGEAHFVENDNLVISCATNKCRVHKNDRETWSFLINDQIVFQFGSFEEAKAVEIKYFKRGFCE